MGRPLQAVGWAAIVLSLASCADDTVDANDGAASFIAYAADFDGYRSWSQTTVFDDGGAGGSVHPGAELVEYINRPSPTDGGVFSEGTVIVKEGIDGDPATRQAFAMAKRGGTYNAGGALGWEWFEVQNIDAAGDVQIIWRGTVPPQGETYSGNVNGDCNTCHRQAPHDAVFDQ
ncbi:MAG TPA: hypothetical protein VGM06_06420 [Polyangiaceae bacterium]|jgi:hypothetical protein